MGSGDRRRGHDAPNSFDLDVHDTLQGLRLVRREVLRDKVRPGRPAEGDAADEAARAAVALPEAPGRGEPPDPCVEAHGGSLSYQRQKGETAEEEEGPPTILTRLTFHPAGCAQPAAYGCRGLG